MGPKSNFGLQNQLRNSADILTVLSFVCVGALQAVTQGDDSYGDGALYSRALLIFGIFYMTQVFYFIGIIVEKLYTISK